MVEFMKCQVLNYLFRGDLQTTSANTELTTSVLNSRISSISFKHGSLEKLCKNSNHARVAEIIHSHQ